MELATGAEHLVAGGAGDYTRPAFTSDGRVVYIGSEGGGGWDPLLTGPDQADARVLARGVRVPLRSRPALSADGRWVAFAYDDPSRADSVWLAELDGEARVEISTDFVGCGEPALVQQGGRTLLAFTALPSSKADWRFLYVQDITARLQP